MSESTSEFDQDTQVVSLGEGTFSAVVTDRWNTFVRPDGGYVMAIAVRALGMSLPHPHPFTVTGHFLRPTDPGSVEIKTDVARAGRRHSTGSARVIQGGKEVLRVLGTFGDLSKGEGRSAVGEPPPNIPPPDACQDPWAHVPDGVKVSIGDRTEARTPQVPGWLKGAPTGRPFFEFHQILSDGRPQDALSLIFMADAAPPTVVELGELASVTVDLTVMVRALPAKGWLTMRKQGKNLVDGYFEEDVTMWDSTGSVVATSRQLALIV